MSKRKNILSVSIMGLALSTSSLVHAEGEIGLRDYFTQQGATVEWDKESQTAKVDRKGESTLMFQVGSSDVTILPFKEILHLNEAVRIENGSLILPYEFPHSWKQREDAIQNISIRLETLPLTKQISARYVKEINAIPIQMNPGTIIEYNDKNEPVVVNQANDTIFPIPSLQDESMAGLDLSLPQPRPGLHIVYDGSSFPAFLKMKDDQGKIKPFDDSLPYYQVKISLDGEFAISKNNMDKGEADTASETKPMSKEELLREKQALQDKQDAELRSKELADFNQAKDVQEKLNRFIDRVIPEFKGAQVTNVTELWHGQRWNVLLKADTASASIDFIPASETTSNIAVYKDPALFGNKSTPDDQVKDTAISFVKKLFPKDAANYKFDHIHVGTGSMLSEKEKREISYRVKSVVFQNTTNPKEGLYVTINDATGEFYAMAFNTWDVLKKW